MRSLPMSVSFISCCMVRKVHPYISVHAAQSELLGLVSPFASPGTRPPPLAAVVLTAPAEGLSSRTTLGLAPSTPVKIVPRVSCRPCCIESDVNQQLEQCDHS